MTDIVERWKARLVEEIVRTIDRQRLSVADVKRVQAGHPSTCCPRNGTARKLRCTYCGGRDHNYAAFTKHRGGGKMPGAIRIPMRHWT